MTCIWMIAKCCEVAEVEVNCGVITHQPLPLSITPESSQVNCLHWLLLLKIHWNIMAGIPCFWLCVFLDPLVLCSSYFLVLRRGIFPFVGSPRIDWTSNSCFFPLLLFTKKRKLLLFLTKYPHQQQRKCFCLATATNEKRQKSSTASEYERAFVGNLVKLDVATNYSPGAAKTTILLQATIFVSFWLQKICLTIKHNCCLSLNIQSKTPNLPQLPTE